MFYHISLLYTFSTMTEISSIPLNNDPNSRSPEEDIQFLQQLNTIFTPTVMKENVEKAKNIMYYFKVTILATLLFVLVSMVKSDKGPLIFALAFFLLYSRFFRD